MAQSTENGQLSSLHLVSTQTLANINGGDKKKPSETYSYPRGPGGYGFLN